MPMLRKNILRYVTAILGASIGGQFACGGTDGSAGTVPPCSGVFCSASGSGVSELSGSDTATVDPACADLVDTTNTCGVCVGAYCCDPLVTCSENTECVNFVSCAYDCTTDSCVTECATTYADGYAVYVSVDDCVVAECLSECSTSSSTSTSDCADSWDTTTTCGACMASYCCDATASCESSTECVNFINCAGGCTTDSCVSTCASTYADGYTVYAELAACGSDYCSTECV